MVLKFSKRKAAVWAFRIILILVLVEAGLRIGGFGFLAAQRYENKVDDDSYRILALGESTTANLYNGQSSWPDELESMLNQESNISFVVFNEGIVGAATTEILSKLKGNLDRYDPDMVIVMMGSDDSGDYVRKGVSSRFRSSVKSLRIYKIASYGIKTVKGGIEEKKKAFSMLKYKKEESRLIKASVENPSIESFYELAAFYESNEGYEGLLNISGKLIEIVPYEFKPYYGYGVALYELGRYEEAMKVLEKALSINPNDVMIHRVMGKNYNNLGMYPEAMRMYDQFNYGFMHGMGKYDEEIYIDMAEINMKFGFYSQAYEELKLVVLRNPEKIQEVFWIGKIYRKINASEDAASVFLSILEKNPENYAALTEFALYYLDNGRVDEAEALFRGILESSPENYEAYIEPAWYYLSNGKYAEAEEVFLKVSKDKRNLILLYGHIATRFRENGDPETARKFLEQAAKIRKGYFNPTTHDNYLEMHRILSDRETRMAVMGYPNQDISELKSIFSGKREMIFISNEGNFGKALENSPYEEYFIDNVRGSFGHATLKGNRLIAESAAKAVLDEVHADAGLFSD